LSTIDADSPGVAGWSWRTSVGTPIALTCGNVQDARVKIVRWFVRSRLSRIYLTLVAAATVFASVPSLARLASDGSGYSHPDILPTALSLPGSVPLFAVLVLIDPHEGSQWLGVGGEQGLWIACVGGGALINAAAINGVIAVARGLRARSRSVGRAAAAGGGRARVKM
jgi:hypothetical protein